MSDSIHDVGTQPALAVLAAWRGALLRRFTAVDLVTLLYVAFATAAVLAFSGSDHGGWYWLLTAHALIAILVLLAPAAREETRTNRPDQADPAASSTLAVPSRFACMNSSESRALMRPAT